jgi:hypothetical protein
MPGTANSNGHTTAWIHLAEKEGFTGFIPQIYQSPFSNQLSVYQ